MTDSVITPVDSWRPINLAEIPDEITGLPSLAGGLVYAGRSHLWSGEPEAGKSWIALNACALEILNERHVVFIDFETTEREIKERLRALGVTNMELEYFAYIRPTDPIGSPGVTEYVLAMLEERMPSIVFTDAYAGILDLHELDPNSGADIEKLNRVFFRPVLETGAATVTLDHLTKDKERRGKFSIGSERKVGVVDVHLGFEIEKGKPFGRGRKGLIHVRRWKDRPGHLPPRPCDIKAVSDPATGQVDFTMEQVQQVDADHPFRPTALMEKVSRYLEERGEAVVRSVLEEDVKGRAEYLRSACEVLTKEGYVEETLGPKRGMSYVRLYEHKKAYREALDPEVKA